MDKLYKKDNSGTIRVWWAEIKENNYRMHSGQLNGKITSSYWTMCNGKNIGRSNETTPEYQAVAEVEAMYNKRLKKGYTYHIKDVDKAKEVLVKPMLAHHYEDYKHRLTWPLWVQPKLDGIRCIANSSGLWTRKNEPIKSCPHIEGLLINICKEYGIQLDGELYNHSLRDDFNQITSLVKRQKIDLEHKSKVRDLVQFHVYDHLDVTKDFSVRFNYLENTVFQGSNELSKSILLLESDIVYNNNQLEEVYEKYLTEGYEGMMLRLDKPYQCKRTPFLLKRKEVMDDEFKIVDVEEGRGNRSGMAGRALFKTKKGVEFSASFKGGVELYKKILKHRDEVIGKIATVEFQNYTPDGSPRFPRVKVIHDWN